MDGMMFVMCVHTLPTPNTSQLSMKRKEDFYRVRGGGGDKESHLHYVMTVSCGQTSVGSHMKTQQAFQDS